MDNLTNSKFFTPAVVVLGLVLFFMLFGNAITNKVADRVLERISKPYSPSPFGPGVDPDKLDGYKGAQFQTLEVTDPGEKSWELEWEANRDN